MEWSKISKVYLGSMCTAVLIRCDSASNPPSPRHSGSNTRALLVSQDTVDDISLWPLPIGVYTSFLFKKLVWLLRAIYSIVWRLSLLYPHRRISAKTAENRQRRQLRIDPEIYLDRQARLPLIYLRHRLVKIIHPTTASIFNGAK